MTSVMTETDFLDHPPQSELPPVPDSEVPRPNRRVILPPERRARDHKLALRLDQLGENPWTAKVTDMIDIETGKTFHDLGPLIEHWIFAGPAKRRAAAFNAIFSAFHARTDTSGFRAYVARLPLQKAKPGTLADAIKAITKRYGRMMANAKRDGLAKAVAVFVHPRWDNELGLWDVHLHCIVDVQPGRDDPFFLRLAMNFSTPKSIGKARNIASWANYCAGWVVDHRDIANWPDHAVLEFWGLKAPQLIRKAGDLAAFAATLKGKNLRWEDDKVVIEDKDRPTTRQDARTHPLRSPKQVAYAVVRLGGCKRKCAIIRYDRVVRERSAADKGDVSLARAHVYPTRTTGSIPSTGSALQGRGENMRRLRRRLALWERIWPWGTQVRPAGPIQRRLGNEGVVLIGNRSGSRRSRLHRSG